MKKQTASRFGTRALLAFAVLLLALCCRSGTQGSIDGETHFLRSCTGAAECGSTLSCMCGVCALECASNSECSDLASSAACIPSDDRSDDTCTIAATPAMCDAPCSEDDDCASLGAGFRCSSGFCRESSSLGTGGNGGVSTTPTSSSGAGGAEECPSDEVAGAEVVVLGDVFVAQTREIPPALEELARDAGALSATENYRDHSSITLNSLTIDNGLLLDGFLAAEEESPVRVVVMNGGGADLLMKSCPSDPTPDCPLMVDAVAGAEQLLSRMSADGVEHVVWFYYPDPMAPLLLQELDVLRPLLEAACESSAVPCHWVDLRPTFDGRYDEYMQSDFVPTAAGAEAAAATIWSTMQEHCVAQ